MYCTGPTVTGKSKIVRVIRTDRRDNLGVIELLKGRRVATCVVRVLLPHNNKIVRSNRQTGHIGSENSLLSVLFVCRLVGCFPEKLTNNCTGCWKISLLISVHNGRPDTDYKPSSRKIDITCNL